MRLQPLIAILLRQMYLMRESFARIFQLFAWVAIDIILWGFITKYLNKVSAAGVNFTATMLGAILVWDFLIRVMQGLTMAFFEDMWSRNFLNIFATPLRISEYLGGLVLSSIVTSAVGLVVMLVLAVGLFDLPYFSYGVMLAVFLFVLFLFGISLGIIACAMVLRWGPAAEWFIWPIPAFISPFVGVFYPVATLPHWMQYVSYILPPSYVFEGMRSIVQGDGAAFPVLMGSAALAFGYILLACWIFARVYRRAVRTGLIARYSAENIG